MSSKPNQAWNGHKYFFLVDFTFTFHAGTWYFSATSRESLMQKPVTYTVALFSCSKMQTVFSVQRHKKAKTLSPVFCLTEPFSLPVTPTPQHIFFFQFTLTRYKCSFVLEEIYKIWKETVSNLLRELRVFKIRRLNDWPDTHFKRDALFKNKRGMICSLPFFFSFCV